ncbi:MAG: Gfo/Idh/MocA family oxidoreductase [Acidobacteriota bacterium]|nr:Gfo/Idh/MocA family oxidoreductase [Acidobacteriota bacterium]
MTLKVAMIGYGAVGSIHADQLAADPAVELAAVYGPKAEKASAFATAHGIKNARTNIAEALAGADVAIVCSPSTLHFQQASECLDHGVQTLVELPPCLTAGEAEALGELADQHGVLLGCAHTSRFVAPYFRIRESIPNIVLGTIQEFNYTRHHQLRERSWADNALVHHGAHPVDILLDWCGGLEPRGCVALPDARHAQSVAMLGKLPSGGPATITVTYASKLPHLRMLVVGERHTLETDGFTYLRSDLPDLQFAGDAQQVYEQAIRAQDMEFLRACQGKGNFVPWEETLKMIRIMDRFQALAEAE